MATFKPSEAMKTLITNGSIKTNHYDPKDGVYRFANTPKLDSYLKSKGFKKGVDYKIDNLAMPAKHKQRFVWINKKK